MHVFAAVVFVVTLLGCVYVVAAIALLLRFGKGTAARGTAALPSVTVLKPLAGVEPGLYHALASWCEQDHPDYDVVFCAHSRDDAAVAVAERVMLDYPRCRARLLVGDDPAMRNPKMANLAKAEDAIAGALVVIADSDVRIDATVLRALCGSFADPGVGAATCLYRAEPRDGFVSQLGAAYVDDQFAPSVLVATAIGPLRFCLGAVMAVRRDVLQQIGGFRALGPYLADDHRLGELVAQAGYRVDLSRCVVAIAVDETRFADLWAHELRWARTSMAQAPIG
jgi:ceramide glucosyltransferase